MTPEEVLALPGHESPAQPKFEIETERIDASMRGSAFQRLVPSRCVIRCLSCGGDGVQELARVRCLGCGETQDITTEG